MDSFGGSGGGFGGGGGGGGGYMQDGGGFGSPMTDSQEKKVGDEHCEISTVDYPQHNSDAVFNLFFSVPQQEPSPFSHVQSNSFTVQHTTKQKIYSS